MRTHYKLLSNPAGITHKLFWGDTEPTYQTREGDLWIDTSGSTVVIKGYSGTSWEAATVGSETVTLSKLAATAKTHFLSYQVEDLAAGADIAARPIFVVPAGLMATLTGARIIPQGDDAGFDASNACVVTLTDGTNTIVSKQYDDDPAFPDSGVADSLGDLDATYKALAAGETLCLSVTNGATANPPAFSLQIEMTLADAS